MSKSLGNVIDPLEVIDGCALDSLTSKLNKSNLGPKEILNGIKEKKREFPDGIPPCGTDSLRFALLTHMTAPRSINLDVNRIIGYRLFSSKIWNGVKLFLYYSGDKFTPKPVSEITLSAADHWILAKLSKVAVSSNKNLEIHNYGAFANELYDFFLKQFCDVYIEASKVALQGSSEEAKDAALSVLYIVLDSSLRLFHPMMPYITEELYQRLPHTTKNRKESIFLTSYPTGVEEFKADQDLEANFDSLISINSTIRSIFDSVGIQKTHKPEVVIKVGASSDISFFEGIIELTKFLTGSGSVAIASSDSTDPSGSISKVVGDQTIFVKVVGFIDIKQEITRLQKAKGKVDKYIEGTNKKMTGKSGAKMPEHVKEENIAKLALYKSQIEAYDQSIQTLQNIN